MTKVTVNRADWNASNGKYLEQLLDALENGCRTAKEVYEYNKDSFKGVFTENQVANKLTSLKSKDEYKQYFEPPEPVGVSGINSQQLQQLFSQILPRPSPSTPSRKKQKTTDNADHGEEDEILEELDSEDEKPCLPVSEAKAVTGYYWIVDIPTRDHVLIIFKKSQDVVKTLTAKSPKCLKLVISVALPTADVLMRVTTMPPQEIYHCLTNLEYPIEILLSRH